MSDHLSFPHCVPFLLPFWELLRCEKPLEEHWLQLWNSLAVCRPGRVLVGEQHTRWIARNSSGTLRRPWPSLRLAESRSGSVARPGAHNHKARAIAFAIGLHQSRHAKSAFAGRIKWVRGRRKEEQWEKSPGREWGQERGPLSVLVPHNDLKYTLRSWTDVQKIFESLLEILAWDRS